MKKTAVCLTLGIMLLVPSMTPVFAHFYPAMQKGLTPEMALDFCEFFYEEYLLLGAYELQIQHTIYPRIRGCIDLYEHIVWNVDHPDRDRILIAEIEKQETDSSHVKERHHEKFDTVPEWIQNDAQRWALGEIKTTQYAYGVKALINANVISPQAQDMSEIRQCDHDTLCILDGDYLLYSITDNFDEDVITIKHTFEEITENKIKVIEEKISKEGKEISEFTINPLTGLIDKSTKENQCCNPYQFMYPTPIDKDSFLNSNNQIKITSETLFTFKEIQKDAVIATDETGNYFETIEKGTGIVFTIKQEKYEIIPLWQKINLIETNIFFRDRGIQLEELEIPEWWKDNVRWYIDGIVSEEEYLNAMQYLLEVKAIRV